MDDVTQEPPADDPVLPPDPAPATPEFGESGHAPGAVQSLKLAMRRARFDDAERVGVQADLRALQIGRLEVLQDALTPLLAQIPKSADLFDVGVMPGATPRLFVDMIGFVEMGRDARVYRFLQDTRYRRITLAETLDVPTMVDAITDYVARRLLERDKALAADAYGDPTPSVAPTTTSPAAIDKTGGAVPDVATANARAIETAKGPAKPRRKRRLLHWSGLAFAFLIDLLGAITFFLLLVVAGWLLWNRLHGQV